MSLGGELDSLLLSYDEQSETKKDEPRGRIGLPTSFLPRKRSADELPRLSAEVRIRT
jgi:hypothetical protein